MSLDIPNNVLEQIQMTPEQLRLEIAIYLYDKKKLTMGQAKKLAGLSQIDFQKELSNRGVYIHYDESDFRKDLENLDIDLT